MRERHSFFYSHIADFFGLQKPSPLTISSGVEGRTLTDNGIMLRSDAFNRCFFPGRHLTISSHSDSNGLYVNGWELKVTTGGQTHTTTYETETLSLLMPMASQVEISPLLSTEPLAAGMLEADIDPNRPCDVYDTAGRIIRSASLLILPKGIYILKQGHATRKMINW